jgi:hypothetical protein
MSAVQTSRYSVICVTFTGRPWFVVDTAKGYSEEVDRFGTECAARHAARMLDAGVASVDPHAIVGCKVVAA